MNLRVPYNAGNFLTSWKPVSFSRRTVLHGVSKYVTSETFVLSLLRGLSGKFPNISHKNFPVVPWSYSALSPSKYSPLLCMHRCQRFFNVLKHSWKAVLGMLRKCVSEFVLIASIHSNGSLSGLIWALETGRSQLVRDLKSTEAVEGQLSRVWPRRHGQGTMNVRGRCHVGASIDSPATHHVFFSWLLHEDVA